MATRYHYQINSDHKQYWEEVKAYGRWLPDRVTAVRLAKRAARFYQSEVRLTEGKNPFSVSGSYFRHQQQ